MQKPPLTDLLGKKLLLADGAIGTILVGMGSIPSSDFALLNITRPDVIQKIHHQYVQAGSHIIYTHTFGANYYALKKQGHENKVVEINWNAVRNAHIVAPHHIYVAGNIGPSGLSASDKINPQEFEAHYSNQAHVLVSQGVDLLTIETMTNLPELKMILQGCFKGNSKKLPIFVSVTPKNDGNLSDGTPLKVWIDYLNQQPIQAVGINCFGEFKKLRILTNQLEQLSQHPLVLKPNAGLPALVSKKWIYPIDSGEFCDQIKALTSQKVAIVGGCCGTTPEYIKKLSESFL